MSNDWFVYILRCQDSSLYTGITTDLDRRLKEHKKGVASKYTRSFGADTFVYTKKMATKSEVLKKEQKIKRLSRKAKEQLIGKNKL